MTEEMLGGEQQNDESDTDLSVRGEHTKHERSMLFSRYATGVSQGGQHPRKKLLQRPASLEISEFPGTIIQTAGWKQCLRVEWPHALKWSGFFGSFLFHFRLVSELKLSV